MARVFGFRKFIDSYFSPEFYSKGPGGATPRLEFFPERLSGDLDARFMDGFIRILRVPIVWTTVAFYAAILYGIVLYLGAPKPPSVLFSVALAIGLIWLVFVYVVWHRLGSRHHRLRNFILNFLFAGMSSSMGWGVYASWSHMPEAYIGIMATMIGSVLGGATTIISYSRTSYTIFLSGWMLPGIVFMAQRTGVFYWIMEGLFVTGFISFTVVNWMEYAKQRYTFDLNRRLEDELGRSDRLLLNILPAQIAEELKGTGTAKPVKFDSVTVIFTDFVGFTRIAEGLTPEELVSELDKCFSYFDAVTEKYKLEKLKTIGDAFMCAGGIPKPNRTHAIDAALAALEIQAFMNQMRAMKEQLRLPYWELRLDMHSGELIAGVVGEKKFAYDVWGDTVNTASRMESSGTPGQINISLATHEQIGKLFACEHRGKVPAKGKGEIDMYYLKSIRPEFSLAGEGIVPNGLFHEYYAALEARADA